MDHPISFFSRALRDAEVRYDIMEKQAYAWVKDLKAFKVYVLHLKIIAYVPSSSMKDILIQPNIDRRRSKWIAKILEFELEIKPTKLVKGQGLARLLVESNYKTFEVNFINTFPKNQQAEFYDKGPQDNPPFSECA
jgi:hypothetical protein